MQSAIFDSVLTNANFNRQLGTIHHSECVPLLTLIDMLTSAGPFVLRASLAQSESETDDGRVSNPEFKKYLAAREVCMFMSPSTGVTDGAATILLTLANRTHIVDIRVMTTQILLRQST